MTLEEAEAKLNIEVLMLAEGAKNRPGGNHPKISITIHNTANDSTGADARSHARYMATKEAVNRKVSWHYTVDDKRVVKHLPTSERSWHTSKSNANASSISIEICQNKDGDFAAACERAALLTAVLCARLGITELKRHRDWTGKNCPAKLVATYGWNWFTTMVFAYLAGLESS